MDFIYRANGTILENNTDLLFNLFLVKRGLVEKSRRTVREFWCDTMTCKIDSCKMMGSC